MTASQAQLPTHPGLTANLKTTARLYKDHGWAFTRVLLKPVLYQLIGIYGCLILSYLAMDAMVLWFPRLFSIQPFWLFAVILPIAFGFIYLFCLGFWQYLVYMVSLCRSAHALLSGQAPDFSADYRIVAQHPGPYTGYLLILVAVQALPVLGYGLVTIAATALGVALGMEALLFGLVVFALFMGLLFLAAMVATVYLSLGFQVLAFEDTRSGGLAVARRSIGLVHGNFWRTAALQVCWVVVTTVLAPGLAILLVQLTGLMGGLNIFHDWMLALILDQAQPLGEGLDPIPGYAGLYEAVQSFQGEIAEALSSTVVSSVVTLVLLPLGTFSFTQLYWGIRAQRENA